MERGRGRREETIRKGPWTEQEDLQLVSYVKLFGNRRWDFIAKVSGLRRTGKSCRLRWVNYLHPGLKRGKMSPHEERLVLELHSKWGNSWSRIARKLPGRTDNEIKNYWRTQTRKKAQVKKRATCPSSSPSRSASSSSGGCNLHADSAPVVNTKERSFYDTGGKVEGKGDDNREQTADDKGYCWDEIWKDIELLGDDAMGSEFYGTGGELVISPIWDYGTKAAWATEDEETGAGMFYQFGAILTG